MPDPEYSDLSSEDEYGDVLNNGPGSNHKVKSEKRDEDEYRLQSALKPPRATTYTAQALYDQIINCDVDLNPEYQRDVVWTKEKQTGLIDSILRNFYIPPVIFAVNVADDGQETKTCIDGKQRLTSIYKFMDGDIPHRDPITNEKFWFRIKDSVHDGKKARLLPDRYRRAFANKQIVCVEYQDLTDANERDIFQRVQLGMALTSAEKLHVIATPRAQFIRSILASHISETVLGGPKFPWDRARGSDFRCISQAVFVMSKWTSSTLTGAGSLPQVEKWLRETGESNTKGRATPKKRAVGRPPKTRSKGKAKAKEDDVDDDDDDEEDQIDDGDYIDAPQVPEAFAKKVIETYDMLVAMVCDSKLNKAFYAYPKVSPIEMICIPILIFAHGVHPKPADKFTPSELASAISELRARVRREHKDIRMNDRIGKFMVNCIRNIKKSELPTTSSKKSASITSGAAPMSATPTTTKRKRNFVDDDDEDEYTNSRSSRSKTKSNSARKKTSGHIQQPTPTPSVSSGPSQKHTSLKDHPGSISAPNPQRLPSPPGPNQQGTGPQATYDRSHAGSTEVKAETSPVSGPPMMGIGMIPGGGMSLQNVPPGFVEQVLGMQMMGLSPMPNMQSQGMIPPLQMMLSQANLPMGPHVSQGAPPTGTQGQGPPLDKKMSVAEMQQWVNGHGHGQQR